MTSRVDSLIAQHESQDPYERFSNSMQNQKTKTSYLNEVRDFSEWIGLNYVELIELGTKNLPTLTDKLGEYIQHVLSDQRKKDGTEYGYGKGKWIKKAVIKFYSENHISIKVSRNDKINTLTKAIPTDKRKPTKEEIQQLLNICPNYKLKCAVALSKDSGLRVSDLVQVQYQHVKDALTSDDQFGGFVLKIEKTDKIALVCFGSETVKYLKFWLVELESKLGRKLTDTDYLFPHTKNQGMIGEKSDADALDRMLNNQIARLGLKGQVSFNGMRYFFESNLETVLNMNIITTIQGKQIGNSTKHYSKHDVSEMLELYKPAYRVLMVESTDNTEEIQGLRQEIIKMQDRILHSERLYKLSEEARNEEKDRDNI